MGQVLVHLVVVTAESLQQGDEESVMEGHFCKDLWLSGGGEGAEL